MRIADAGAQKTIFFEVFFISYIKPTGNYNFFLDGKPGNLVNLSLGSVYPFRHVFKEFMLPDMWNAFNS